MKLTCSDRLHEIEFAFIRFRSRTFQKGHEKCSPANELTATELKCAYVHAQGLLQREEP